MPHLSYDRERTARGCSLRTFCIHLEKCLLPICTFPLAIRSSSAHRGAKNAKGSEAVQFDLTEDQALLRDMVDRLAADQYSFEVHRSAIASPGGWNHDFWMQLT